MKEPKFWRRLLGMAALLLAVGIGSAGVLRAQGIIIEPPPNRQPMPSVRGPITIETHSVSADIDGPMATVRVSQVFRNETNRVVEGAYVFPLPEDAAVSDFQMTVNGHVLEGSLLSKDEARRIYEDIVRRQRDPALLEYLGRGLFQTSVFPIPPGESRKVDLTYTELLPLDAGMYHFNYPLRTQHFSSAPVQDLTINVRLRNQPGLRTIYSPSHDVSVDRTADDSADIGFEAVNAHPASDFDLYFGVSDSAVGLNLLSYKPATEDGFFVLLAAPEVEVRPEDVVRRDIVVVLDVSGSMEGEKIQQARDAAHFVVEHLNPGDRFNLISFSTGVRLWDGHLSEIDDESVRFAHEWIDSLRASGSTDINRALLEALAQLNAGAEAQDSRPGYVLFLTDGLPTQGEIETAKIIRNSLNNAPQEETVRLFTFGVGYDVNTDLLDTLAHELGGRSSYVRPDERIDEAVSEFYSAVSTPVLASVQLDFGNDAVVDDVYPFPLPDLFAGEQLVVVGRYRNGTPVTIDLTGQVNDRLVTISYPNQQLVDSGGEPSVARLWATRKIGVLMDQIRRNGPQKELVDEIVDLSLAYGVVTPFTSYLVVEPGMLEGEVSAMPDRASGAPAADLPEPPISLRAAVGAVAAEEAESAASAPASGQDAITASEERSRMQEADSVEDHESLRYLAGKTFIQQGAVNGPDGESLALWVDTLYVDTMHVRTVSFGTESYFELADDPQMAQWLSVSPELIVVIDDENALRISMSLDAAENDQGESTASPNEASGSVNDQMEAPEEREGSILQDLLDWIFGKSSQ